MILATRSAYLKLLAAAATIGAIAAGAVSFTIPRRYVSTAMMRLTPPAVAGEPAWQIEAEAAHRLPEMRGEVLSRQSLTEIIERPAIDLYRQERATQPLEDVMVDMRRDIHIELVPAPARAQGRIPLTLRVTFEYPDPVKAQAVVRHLSARLSQLKSGTAGSGLAEVLTPASLPEKPSQPDRLAIVAIGLGAGLAIGILFAFLHRRGVKWTLRVAGCAVAGSILAFAVSLLMPDAFADGQKTYPFVGLGAFAGVVCGAFLLRVRGTGSQYARLIAFCAAGGAIAGGFASFAVPERYVSTATMRIFPLPGGAAQVEIEPAERLREIAEEVLTRSSLSELIQRPSLDLYRAERLRRPLEDVIEDMRRLDLRIAPTPAPGLTGLGPEGNFQISFEYADSFKAQAVVRELVTKFTELNAKLEQTPDGEAVSGGLGLEAAEPAAPAIGRLSGELYAPFAHKPDGETVSSTFVLEVDEAATEPASPVSPNRPAVAAIGLLAGMLLGSLLAFRGWLVARHAATPGPHASYWKYTLGAAAIGALAAGLGSFAIPNRYVSTAVVRVVPFHVRGAGAQAEIEYTARLSQLTEGILSRDGLALLIQRPALDLYPMGRRWRPMEDIVDDMRRRDLRIAPTETTEFAGSSHLTSFQISFEYADRDKAQAVVRELVTEFTERIVEVERVLLRDNMPGSLKLEVVDPATLPESPVFPNRPAIAAIGLLAGVVLGSFRTLCHRPGARRQPAAPGPRPSYWKYALTTAALGAIAAALASFAFPNRYVSTAVLHLVSTDPRSAASAASGENMQEELRPVLSRDSLAEIIQRPELQLYAPERRRHSLDEVIQRMRDRDLRVTPLRDSPLGGRPTAFRISFEYSDAAKAHSSVQALVAKFIEGAMPEQFVTFASTAASQRKPATAYLEVLDTASMPERPVSPNRAAIGAGGGLAGLLLGLAIARLRRRARQKL
jgi:uncharacterized protein involved in exopolysaccharide biosynthesis